MWQRARPAHQIRPPPLAVRQHGSAECLRIDHFGQQAVFVQDRSDHIYVSTRRLGCIDHAGHYNTPKPAGRAIHCNDPPIGTGYNCWIGLLQAQDSFGILELSRIDIAVCVQRRHETRLMRGCISEPRRSVGVTHPGDQQVPAGPTFASLDKSYVPLGDHDPQLELGQPCMMTGGAHKLR
jgi:hypothetical protein